MPLIRPKPPTRRPGLGAAKLVLAAIAAGIGASLLFHSTVGSPPALVQPSTPEGVVAAPTVQAGESAVEALEPEGTGGSAGPDTAGLRPGSKKEQETNGRTSEPRTALTRSADPSTGALPAAPEPLTPADPAPVERPESRDEPGTDAPSPPVELPADKSAPGDPGPASTTDGAAPPPPPTAPTGG